MNIARNILAVIGVIALIALLAAAPKIIKYKSAFASFDSKAFSTYWTMFDRLVETGNPAEATVWKRKVADDVSYEDLVQSIKTIAEERNIRGVGELPLGDQVAAMEGKPWRKLAIFLYCNPLTAKKMVDHNAAYSAYLPCRISIVEDDKKQLWLYTLDMDMMIHGGKPLPADLLKEALEVKNIMLDVLERGSKGDF